MLKSLVIVLSALILFAVDSGYAQTMHPILQRESYRPGYDIPLNIPHGTWDFDEWPGIDHEAVYKEQFRYNEYPDEKIKIDYTQTDFDWDDHEGYLKSPEVLTERGKIDINVILDNDDINHTLVGIFTHPDDDILLAGGLMAHAVKRGWIVKVYMVSNGADGLAGVSQSASEELGGYNSFGVMADGRIIVETDSSGLMKMNLVKEWSTIPGVEAQIIPVDLTINGKRVVQIGETPGLDWKKTFGEDTQARGAIAWKCLDILRREKPGIVVTHGSDGEYGNYLHRLTHDVVLDAISKIDSSPMLFTAFPEYNYHDHITHFLDLDENERYSRTKKFEAFTAISFIHQEGMDYDKPWDPTDELMDGAFVKDYGYTPVEGYPPRYEFFQLVRIPGR